MSDWKEGAEVRPSNIGSSLCSMFVMSSLPQYINTTAFVCELLSFAQESKITEVPLANEVICCQGSDFERLKFDNIPHVADCDNNLYFTYLQIFAEWLYLKNYDEDKYHDFMGILSDEEKGLLSKLKGVDIKADDYESFKSRADTLEDIVKSPEFSEVVKKYKNFRNEESVSDFFKIKPVEDGVAEIKTTLQYCDLENCIDLSAIAFCRHCEIAGLNKDFLYKMKRELFGVSPLEDEQFEKIWQVFDESIPDEERFREIIKDPAKMQLLREISTNFSKNFRNGQFIIDIIKKLTDEEKNDIICQIAENRSIPVELQNNIEQILENPELLKGQHRYASTWLLGLIYNPGIEFNPYELAHKCYEAHAPLSNIFYRFVHKNPLFNPLKVWEIYTDNSMANVNQLYQILAKNHELDGGEVEEQPIKDVSGEYVVGISVKVDGEHKEIRGIDMFRRHYEITKKLPEPWQKFIEICRELGICVFTDDNKAICENMVKDGAPIVIHTDAKNPGKILSVYINKKVLRAQLYKLGDEVAKSGSDIRIPETLGKINGCLRILEKKLGSRGLLSLGRE